METNPASLAVQQGQQAGPSRKGRAVNVPGLAGHVVGTTSTHLCRCSVRAATDDMQIDGCACVPRKLYFQEQAVGQSRPVGCSLPAPALESDTLSLTCKMLGGWGLF